MKELGDLEDLVPLDRHLRAHPCEAARANLQLRDANGVLVGHGERELARRLRNEPAGTVAVLLLERPEPLERVQKVLGVANVLVVVEPRDRRGDDGACLARIIALGLAEQVTQPGRRIVLALIGCRGRRPAPRRRGRPRSRRRMRQGCC